MENNNTTIFVKLVEKVGEFTLRPLVLDRDVTTLHAWMNASHATYWMMQNTIVEEVRVEQERILSTGYTQLFIGELNGQAMFLLEFYDAQKDLISKYYDAQPGDFGMHILLAPVKQRIPQFSWHVFTVILDYIFSLEKVQRVVVEPDVNNEKIHVLNIKAGFQYQKQIQLPYKKAALAFCSRQAYAQAVATHKLAFA